MMASQSEADAPFTKTWNFYLLCALAVIDGADTQLLPSSFRALEADLGFNLQELLLLNCTQGLAIALSGPFWAALVDNGARHRILLTVGALGWGICTIILAFTDHFWAALIIRGCVGIFLGTLLPVVQSMVAQGSAVDDRGRAFGMIDMSQKVLGQTCANIAVTSTSNSLVLGYRGWRFSFFTIGSMSILLAIAVNLLMADVERPFTPEKVSALAELRKIVSFLKVKTFAVVISQGMLGSIPWVALNMTTMYYQYCGMSDMHAGVAYSLLLLGCGGGALFGGWLGDRLTAWSKYHGRPLVAQLSVFLGMPICLVMFVAVPPQPWTFEVQAVLSFTLGFVANWCASGCNKPIFVDIVPQDNTASVVAWDQAIETGFANLAGNAVFNMVCTMFGYSRSAEGHQVEDLRTGVRLANAYALAHAILFNLLVFWTCCFALYSLLHFTYKYDYDRAHAPDDSKPTETKPMLDKEASYPNGEYGSSDEKVQI